MNKNIIYIGIAALVGLFGGWLIFSSSSQESISNKDASEMSDHDHTTDYAQMWTCSMHPQIMQPEPGNCPICGMDLILAESSADGLAMNEIKMTKNAMALANIGTARIGEGKGEGSMEGIALSGRIKVNEEEETVQSSYFDGRLERLNVSYEGEQVKKGQLMATIYAPDLVAAQQELISSLSLRESQPALYKAVRNKLKLWKLTEDQINTIEKTRKVKEYFPIYATVSGTVSEKLVSEGDYVKQGEPLFKLMDLNSVWVEFDVYENQLSSLETGDKIKLTTNAYPNKSFAATIIFIDPILNERTRTVAVRATLNNRDGVFKPGMFVKGQIESLKETGDDFSNALMVPVSAVMWTGERSIVYLKTNPNEPVFKMQEVSLGNRIGEMYEIVDGLAAGDEIVTNGTFTVDAAAQLQGKSSMMSRGLGMDEQSRELSSARLQFPNTFKSSFKSLIPLYFDVKDALVNSNSESASKYAKELFTKLQTLEIANLSEAAKLHIMEIIRALENISITDNIQSQRDNFIVLNENMVPISLNVGGMENVIFVQKCPMANNDKGAFWLSKDREIRNPYYGNQMMTCGSIVDTIN